MTTEQHQALERVDELFEQLVDAINVWLVLTTRSSDQLVLARSRMDDLSRLKQMMHKALKSKTGNGERVWQVINMVITVAVNYILNKLTDSSHYQFCREQIAICLRLFVKARDL